MPEIHRADPAARRRAIVTVLVIAGLGVCGYFALEAWLDGTVEGDPAQARESLLSVLVWGTWIVALAIAAFGARLWLVGGRVRRGQRFPLPGAKLLRDTPVRTGRGARVRGTLLRAICVVLFALAAGLVLAVRRLVAVLG